jgi:TfoX/Sxy family transcriptional regulator of competence genes
VAYDEDLAERIRDVLADAPDLFERKMFGGIAFMLGEHMVCGVVREDLMLRLGPEGVDRALGEAHTKPMTFTGPPMRSMVFVEPSGIREDADLAGWIGRAREFVATLPPKKPRRERRPRPPRI